MDKKGIAAEATEKQGPEMRYGMDRYICVRVGHGVT